LDGTASAEIRDKYAPLEGLLKDALRLSRLIRKGRESKGSLDFDFPEVRAVLSNGRVVDIRKKERLETHRLIEDFMVTANEAVATFLDKSRVPAIYRIHEPPEKRDLEDLVAFLDAYRIPHKGLDLSTPRGMQGLIKSVKGGPWEASVSTLSLRSLKLAVYATRNAGHFGLGLESYCHFTSPIRRYPDLVVHRSLKRALHGEKSGQPVRNYAKISLQNSEQERNAEKAERESQRLLQLRFMEGQVGREFEGTVRHLTAHGAFVELDPYGVEGFLPLESLTDDSYRFDEPSLSLKGAHGSKVQIGDRTSVKVLTVDMVLQRLTLTRIYGGKSSHPSKP
jgi:ribonuclease R